MVSINNSDKNEEDDDEGDYKGQNEGEDEQSQSDNEDNVETPQKIVNILMGVQAQTVLTAKERRDMEVNAIDSGVNSFYCFIIPYIYFIFF